MDDLCLCRSCLSTNALEYIELEALLPNGKTYFDCFNACTQLKAKLGDNLPSMLCAKCAKDLRNCYEFIQLAHESDKVLHKRLSNAINSNKTVQILNPKNDVFKDTDIENMEIVVIESLDDKIVENALVEERLDNEIPVFDEYEYCKEADYIVEIDEHEQAEKNTTWKCSECKSYFDSEISYEHHIKCHKNILPFRCVQCKKEFRTRKALEKHAIARHKSVCDRVDNVKQQKKETKCGKLDCITLISCIHCNKVFSSKEMLQIHEQQQHNAFHLTSCPICRKVFSSNDPHDLNDHLRKDHSNNRKSSDDFADYIIEHCETANSDVESAQCLKTKGNDKSSILQECTFCKKKLLSRNMEKHMKLHTKTQENFLCAYCPRHFKNQKSVRQHEKTHFEKSEDVIYECSACDKTYSTSSLLEQHRKNTHKEREHICTICGNAFKLRNQLTNHMKLHLEKNIQCPHCDKKYARQFDLNVHMRSHTGEMPYECHLCEKRFAIKVRLTYHLQKHYGIKHHCKECGAQFNSKQKLKSHSFKHTGMPYRCELCDGHGFPNRDVFKRHLLRVHHATISEEALLEMFQRYTGKTTRIREVSVMLEDEIEMSQEESISNDKNYKQISLQADVKEIKEK